MSGIKTSQETVYFAPTAKRRFLTKRGAAYAEAVALIKRKYPTEREQYDYDNGRLISPGWHWREDERLQRVHARLFRNFLRRLRK